MTYVKRRFTRKPKDTLAQAIKHLWPGEELICTVRTYEAIKDRVDTLAIAQHGRKLETIPYGAIKKIRRVA